MIDIPVERKEKNPLHNIRKNDNETYDSECLIEEEKELKLTQANGVLNLIQSTYQNEQIKQQTLVQSLSQPSPFSLFSTAPDTSGYVEKELMNYFNVQYYGKLYLGSQQEQMTFIFDTGSSWLWAPTTDCTGANCHPSEKYDTKQSGFYQVLADIPTSIKYGTGGAAGYLSKDQVCLSKNQSTCMKDYSILSVFRTSELDSLQADGILGLAPSNQRTKSSVFVEELFKHGIIKERVFSFYVSKGQSSSRVTFGGYNMDYAAPAADGQNQSITWNYLINSNYWSLSLVKVSLGDKTLKLSTKSAIVDTGTSFLLMPSSDFSQFFSYFSQKMLCGIDKTYNLYFCLCTPENLKTFPSLKIQLGNNVYSMPWESYIQKIMSMDFPYGTGFWILGDNFLNNYYTIFDLEQQRVGFVGSVAYEDIPRSIMDYIQMIVVGLLILIIIYGGYQICFNNNKESVNYREIQRANAISDDRENNHYVQLAGEYNAPHQTISRAHSDLLRQPQAINENQNKDQGSNQRLIA
ncbi:eukaryotic aspartyl protease family protein [Stylonychia lemnae]|uniref:Eukaryotic aspartyl protease family protein n=1 Tax=Stylonychia lemnae TaxID=5949 RepID=A0A077ZNZ0_STYLE|nr:eukaryotic aspartyl protease family protein [Stylonychia lemnae]|eukprot:CDW71184.1 eukaryotic aspartyl protease family protein [Stylonychia lemnae]